MITKCHKKDNVLCGYVNALGNCMMGVCVYPQYEADIQINSPKSLSDECNSKNVHTDQNTVLSADTNKYDTKEILFQLNCVKEHLKFILKTTDKSVDFDIDVLDACISQLEEMWRKN